MRYNVVDRAAGEEKYTSAGVTLSVPLPLPGGVGDDVCRKEAELLHRKRDRLNRERKLYAKNLYYEYRYKMHDWITFSYKYRTIKQRLRRRMAMRELKDTNYEDWTTLSLTRDLFDLELELLDIKQSLYLRLAGMFRYFDGEELEAYLLPVEKAPGFFGRKGFRAAYILSSTFNGFGNSFLIQALKAHGISDAMISFEPSTDREKLRAFLREAAEHGLRIWAAAAEPCCALPMEAEELGKKIISSLRYPIHGLHLVSGPYGNTEGKRGEDGCFQGYLALLEALGRSCREAGMAFSAAVPGDLPGDELAAVFERADRVFLIPERAPTVRQLIALLRKIPAGAGGKAVLVLRVEDIGDQADRETLEREVASATGVNALAYHDLEAALKE